MGSKDRERQKRLQRKRRKNAAKRATYRGGPERAVPSLGDIATMVCIDACAILLGGSERMDDVIRREMLDSGQRAGGIWARLLLELEKFIFDKTPWSLSCAYLAPLRHAFEQNGANQIFSRLWALALTNASDDGAFATATNQDCPQRAAAACQELRLCLDDRNRSPAVGLQGFAQEMVRHETPKELASAYTRLLIAAFASFKAPATTRQLGIADLARDCQALFDRHTDTASSTAWWRCGRLFFAEVFERHANDGYAAVIATYPGLINQLFDAPEAAMWVAKYSGIGDSLRTLHIQSSAHAWLQFLDRQIDLHALPFDDRVRFEISKLKLLLARQKTDAPAERPDFLPAFEELRRLLAHGVPPASRELPAILEAPLLDLYLDAVQALNCEAPALATTESLLQRHPNDFRLACLFATGAVLRGERHKLQALVNHIPRAHIDADLFARSALLWAHLPHGVRIGAAIRPLLFDPFDREHRKQCLLKMSQQLLSHAASVTQYHAELRHLLPYFERDNFVYSELGEGGAVETALVFLATMMAPFHGFKLTLTEAQSRQWVSHAREIAQRSSLGAKLVSQCLKTRSPSFMLEDGVRSAARARIADLRPSAQPQPTTEQSRASKGASPQRRPANHSGQQELFDDHNP